MAKGMYNGGKESLMSGNIDLLNDPISALLVDVSIYSPDLANDFSLADIPAAAIVAEALLVGKALVAVEPFPGQYATKLTADPTVFNSVTSENTVTAIVVFDSQQTESDSILLAFNDEAAELPIVPDGTDITVNWDSGDDGIFRF